MLDLFIYFIIFFVSFGILIAFYFNVYDGSNKRSFFEKEKKIIDNFNNNQETTFKQFFDSEELENTNIKNWTVEWIKKQEKLSEFRHSDIEEFVQNKINISELDYDNISRNLLFIGLAITFGSISLSFTAFPALDDTGTFQIFFQTKFLPNISRALMSTLAAVAWTIIISFLEMGYGKAVNEFSETFKDFLIDDVYPKYPTKDPEHEINRMTDIFQDVATAAQEASENVQNITQVTSLSVDGFNRSIELFVDATNQTQSILSKVEKQQKNIDQQNNNQIEITENLRHSLDGLRAIFKLNSESIESTANSLEEISRSHETNFDHVTKVLESNSNTINAMNDDLNKSMGAMVGVINTVNDNESVYKERLDNIMQRFSSILEEFSNMIGKLDNTTDGLQTNLSNLDNTFNSANESFDTSIQDLGKMIEHMEMSLSEFSENSSGYNESLKNLSKEIPDSVAEKMDILPPLLKEMNDKTSNVIDNLAGVLKKIEDSSAKSSDVLSTNLAKHDASFTSLINNLYDYNNNAIEENSTKIDELINTQNQKFDQLADILAKISEKIKSESPKIFGRIFGSN
tara:strand:- start:1385 stop:3100 length:1716 start_codon:yes stop_codon:yes gene_type:complete